MKNIFLNITLLMKVIIKLLEVHTINIRGITVMLEEDYKTILDIQIITLLGKSIDLIIIRIVH